MQLKYKKSPLRAAQAANAVSSRDGAGTRSRNVTATASSAVCGAIATAASAATATLESASSPIHTAGAYPTGFVPVPFDRSISRIEKLLKDKRTIETQPVSGNEAARKQDIAFKKEEARLNDKFKRHIYLHL